MYFFLLGLGLESGHQGWEKVRFMYCRKIWVKITD